MWTRSFKRLWFIAPLLRIQPTEPVFLHKQHVCHPEPAICQRDGRRAGLRVWSAGLSETGGGGTVSAVRRWHTTQHPEKKNNPLASSCLKGHRTNRRELQIIATVPFQGSLISLMETNRCEVYIKLYLNVHVYSIALWKPPVTLRLWQNKSKGNSHV